MIDLHSHTNESDGTFTPLELVDLAAKVGLDALAISDHDTFAGFDQALPAAQSRGLDLVRGIELSTRVPGSKVRAVHLLGYFLHQPPSEAFREWLGELIAGRRDRNRRLIASLHEQGIDIDLAEVERLGRTLTGRPHFARLLIQKGYVRSFDEAFRRYLGESAPSYVERFAPFVEAAIQRVIDAGGLPVLARILFATCAMRGCAASKCFIPIIVRTTCSATRASRASTIWQFRAARIFMAR